jgi:hypothetical protein
MDVAFDVRAEDKRAGNALVEFLRPLPVRDLLAPRRAVTRTDAGAESLHRSGSGVSGVFRGEHMGT